MKEMKSDRLNVMSDYYQKPISMFDMTMAALFYHPIKVSKASS